MTASKNWIGFRYGMCNESMQGQSWAEQCRVVAEAGYKGIEVAPFSLVQEGVKDLTAENRREMVKVMKDQGLECCGLHWLLAAPPAGLHFTTPDKNVRKKTWAYFDELIDLCGDLGGEVMIFGSPKQRSTMGISIAEAKKYFAEGLAEVADHALQRDVKVLVEHLDKTQSDVVNTVAEAMEIVRELNHAAIQVMFDFHNTLDETEPFEAIIKEYFYHLFHVHVQEMDGGYLGTGNSVNDFVPGFQMLKNLGYEKWISLEVFDFAPGGETIAQESMRVLKEIEAKLS